MRSFVLIAMMSCMACADDYGNQELLRPDASGVDVDAGEDPPHDGALGDEDGGSDAASDAEPPEAGPTMDAGAFDASSTDAGGSDGGSAMDAQSGAFADATAEASTADARAPDGGFESFSAIYRDIIAPQCSSCHVSDERAGLNMSTRALALAELVGVPADTASACNGQGPRVVAGNAANSLLVNKIDAANPRCGARMPRNAPPLDAEDIARIRRWIDQGAHDN